MRITRNPYIIAFSIICFVLVGGSIRTTFAEQSTLDQSNELRIHAIKEDCHAYLERQSRCWLNGEDEQCTFIVERTLPWFQNNYSGLPETVCPLAFRDELFLSRR